MDPECTIYLFLSESNHGIQGSVEVQGTHHPLGSVELTPRDPSSLGPDLSLGHVVEKIIRYDRPFLQRLLHEAGQLALGRCLFEKTLGQIRTLPLHELRSWNLIVASESAWICQLPWILLARDKGFLASSGWTISLRTTRNRPEREVQINRDSKLLMVVPDLVEHHSTGGRQHAQEIVNLLTDKCPSWSRGNRTSVITSWKDFRHQIREWKPTYVYFYGHCAGDGERSRLLFEGDRPGSKEPISTMDVRNFFLSLDPESLPKLFYINGCHTDSGGWLGAGHQFSDLIPAVVAQKTSAVIEAAKIQAKEFLRLLMTKNLAPHEIVRKIYQDPGELGQSQGDFRWATPTVYLDYRSWNWESSRSEPSNPMWRELLDRTKQIDVLMRQTLEGGSVRPPCLATLWFGERDSGVEALRQRAANDLKNEFSTGRYFGTVKSGIKWPEEDLRHPLTVPALIERIFGLENIGDLKSHLRRYVERSNGEKPIIYIDFAPPPGDIPESSHDQNRFHRLSARNIGIFLDRWRDTTAMIARDVGVFLCLGIGLRVENRHTFKLQLSEQAGARDHLETLILHPLEEITVTDLEKFLTRYLAGSLWSSLEPSMRNRVARKIIRETNGLYMKVIAMLERLEEIVDEIYHDGEDDTHGEETDPDAEPT